MLAVEVISSTATIGYAVLLIKQSKPRPSLGLPVADPNEPLHPDDVMFNLRVLIPCYKEKVGGIAANIPAFQSLEGQWKQLAGAKF